jgi:hypothetical protein
LYRDHKRRKASPDDHHGLSGGAFGEVSGKGLHAAPAMLVLLSADLAIPPERAFKEFFKKPMTGFTGS